MPTKVPFRCLHQSIANTAAPRETCYANHMKIYTPSLTTYQAVPGTRVCTTATILRLLQTPTIPCSLNPKLTPNKIHLLLITSPGTHHASSLTSNHRHTHTGINRTTAKPSSPQAKTGAEPQRWNGKPPISVTDHETLGRIKLHVQRHFPASTNRASSHQMKNHRKSSKGNPRNSPQQLQSHPKRKSGRPRRNGGDGWGANGDKLPAFARSLKISLRK